MRKLRKPKIEVRLPQYVVDAMNRDLARNKPKEEKRWEDLVKNMRPESRKRASEKVDKLLSPKKAKGEKAVFGWCWKDTVHGLWLPTCSPIKRACVQEAGFVFGIKNGKSVRVKIVEVSK